MDQAVYSSRGKYWLKTTIKLMGVKMLREKIMRKLPFTLLLVCWIISTPAYAGDLGLVDLLTNQLGVTKD